MSLPPPPAPAARFARLIAALCAAVAARLERPGAAGLAGPLIVAICTRLQRLAGRIARLVARVESGTLAPPRRRPAAPRAGARRPRPAAILLPRGVAWLCRLVPAASVGAAQLQALLDDPEMKTLIAAAPQIGRTLRPLCHLLGVRLPPSLRRPPPAPPPPPRRAAAGRPPPAAPPRRPPSCAKPSPPPPKIAHPGCGPPAPAPA